MKRFDSKNRLVTGLVPTVLLATIALGGCIDRSEDISPIVGSCDTDAAVSAIEQRFRDGQPFRAEVVVAKDGGTVVVNSRSGEDSSGKMIINPLVIRCGSVVVKYVGIGAYRSSNPIEDFDVAENTFTGATGLSKAAKEFEDETIIKEATLRMQLPIPEHASAIGFGDGTTRSYGNMP